MANKPRKSTDQDRYDADPKVLSDDFKELELHDEGMLFIDILYVFLEASY